MATGTAKNQYPTKNKGIFTRLFSRIIPEITELRESVENFKSEIPLIEKTITRIQNHPNYTCETSGFVPFGKFGDRHIIGKDGLINTGVYLSPNPKEALVVDDQTELLGRVYDQVTINYVKKYGKSIEEEVLIDMITETVRDTLTYMKDDDLQIYLESRNIEKDCKISLDVFIRMGQGTDRHQMLLAAYLIEKCVKRGLLSGQLIIDTDSYDRESLYFSSNSDNVYVFTPANASLPYTTESAH